MKTEIVKINEQNIEELSRAAELIRAGQLVAFPTETVYGLGASALLPQAVLKIFAVKKRPADNPLIAHVDGIEMVRRIATEISPLAQKLMERFWPGPLTVILPKKDILPDCVTAGGDTVAVRCPAHPVARKLIALADVPIVAPSANRSGRPSPTTARATAEDMDGLIPMILDGGASSYGVESTVVLPMGDSLRVLRPGGVTPEMLSSVCDSVVLDENILQPIAQGAKVLSPGMKHRHYAPKAPLSVLLGSERAQLSFLQKKAAEDIGILCFAEEKEMFSDAVTVTYGRKNDAASQSKELFEALRRFDALSVRQIYARAPKVEGIGLAVYNRLLRAAEFSVIEVEE